MSVLVSADLQSLELPSYRGCIDGFEPESGLLGWALDLRTPAESIQLRFLVDGMNVLELTTSHPRPDVSKALGDLSTRPGFCIPMSELQRLTNLVTHRPTAVFHVEIGETSLLLPRTTSLPTLQHMVSSLIDVRSSNHQDADILNRLAQTKRDAGILAALPLRPFDEMREGFIEAICIEDQENALTWVMGWISSGDLYDVPVVLVDERKFDGAVLACKYSRADLPEGATGFVGVIKSDWQARKNSKPILYYGDSLRTHLISVPNLPKVSKRDVYLHLEQHRGKEAERGWNDLRKIMTGRESWLAGVDDQLDVKVGVDRLILVPHFGCVVSGWIISYTKIVEGFALKIGSNSLRMDKSSFSTRPRPDLTSVFSDSGILIDRAGFTAVFLGEFNSSNAERPLLKVFFEHASATVHSVGLDHIRLLGESESLDSLLNLFPSLESERFFPPLAAAVKLAYLKRCGAVDVARLLQTSSALVVALPSAYDDCRLIFEEIRYNIERYLDKEVGLIVLAGREQKHRGVDVLFHELSEEISLACSLFYVHEIMAATYILKDTMLMAGADRVCFVAANNILTQAGWRAISEFFRSKAHCAVILSSVDPETGRNSRNGAVSFGCDWSAIKQLSSILEVKIETQPSPVDCLSDICMGAVKIVEAGTFFTQVAPPSRVARLINLFDKDSKRVLTY